jgi:hypothetical protein
MTLPGSIFACALVFPDRLQRIADNSSGSFISD